jgi:hypothetical protein
MGKGGAASPHAENEYRISRHGRKRRQPLLEPQAEIESRRTPAPQERRRP